MNTTEQLTITPKIGMSCSYGIGSDSYHQIIVAVERKGKNIYTLPARIVLGGVSKEIWNSLPQDIREKRCSDAWMEFQESCVDHISDPEIAERAIQRYKEEHCYTLRQRDQKNWDGTPTGIKINVYMSKGNNFGRLHLDCDYEYRDPSF